ncbi:MAG: NACHT domain-containing protein, partial [Anaerolineales bacterium]|nr:NACHT domain-containing protein [Anaerolineales bacterium]
MDQNGHSLQHLLITHDVSLTALCQQFHVDEQTVVNAHHEEAYGRLLTTLTEQDQLPQLYRYLENEYPNIQWRKQVNSIFIHAQRDVDLEIYGDLVGRDKITTTYNQVIYQGVQIDDIEQLPPEEGESPYKGLDFFAEEEAEWFFGRDKLIATIVNRLHDTNFLAIVGDSGSGKSSLVRAGIIPVMKRTRELVNDVVPPHGNWHVHTLRPTARPMAKLADTFFPDASDEALEQATILTNALPKKQKTLLFIDQFEELFTQCKDEAKRQLFIANLLNAQSNSCKIILTIRADFYPQCLRYEELREILKTAQEPIGEMSNEELVEAILKPAEKGDWQFQAGLAEDMLEDVGREPGALPLLSHALLETWKRRRGRILTLSGYDEAGKVRGAIAKTAEATYAKLSTENQKLTQQIFLRLTELGEGTQDTRRRVSQTELGDSQTMQMVTQQLASARLITTSQDGIDVAHEALIREWPRLREWLDANREGLRLHRQLTEVTQRWEALNRDEDALYRGIQLEQAKEWAKTQPEALNKQEEAFLQASLKLRQQIERRRRMQYAGVVIALVVLVVASIVAASIFSQQASENEQLAEDNAAIAATAEARRVDAEQQSRVSLGQSLAALSQIVYQDSYDKELATLLTLEAARLNTDNNGQIEWLVNNSLRPFVASGDEDHFIEILRGHDSYVLSVAFTPNGSYLTSASSDQT